MKGAAYLHTNRPCLGLACFVLYRAEVFSSQPHLNANINNVTLPRNCRTKSFQFFVVDTPQNCWYPSKHLNKSAGGFHVLFCFPFWEMRRTPCFPSSNVLDSPSSKWMDIDGMPSIMSITVPLCLQKGYNNQPVTHLDFNKWKETSVQPKKKKERELNLKEEVQSQ